MKFTVAYFTIILMLLNWPVIQWANRAEPVILGVPFFIFYCYAVALLALVGNIFIGLRLIRDPAGEEDSSQKGPR